MIKVRGGRPLDAGQLGAQKYIFRKLGLGTSLIRSFPFIGALTIITNNIISNI